MNAADKEKEQTGHGFRALLERAMRGEQAAAWELLELYGSHFLHLLVAKRREQGDLPLDAARLVSQAWELLRYEPAPGERGRGGHPLTFAGAEPAAEQPRGPADFDPPTVGLHSPDYPTLGRTDAPTEDKSADEQIESARRRWQHLTVGPLEHKKILKLRLQGASFEEIAEELGLAEPVVRRVIHQLAREGQGNS